MKTNNQREERRYAVSFDFFGSNTANALSPSKGYGAGQVAGSENFPYSFYMNYGKGCTYGRIENDYTRRFAIAF